GWRHEVDYNLAVAEAAGARLGHDPRMEIAMSAADRDFARQRLAGSDEWLAVHAGGGSYSLARRWAPAEFATVARQLELPFVLLGTEVDRAANAEVARLAGGGSLDLTGQTTAKQTTSVLERCRLLISNDSGVVHLAAAVGTPVVAVFGPSNDLAWGPYPARRHRVVRTSLPCSPCFYRGTSLGQPGGCETRDCLRLVTPEMVLRAARELLASPAVA
ncbi:MAG: glycosyltransferase family 9 protein, partial [Chloroflexi bacterium]|nr:glycosyltransferase family 9 protein [Chloroflexota bacterium]